MAYINFDLTDTGSLHTLASPAAGQAGTLPPGMPNTGGLYLIYNQANNNRYIGKAGDLAQRFNGRMLTVNEFGLSQANLGQIGVFWGQASTYSTPAPVGGAAAPNIHTLLNPQPALAFGFRVIRNGFGAAAAMPNAVVGNQGGNINYGGNIVNATVDGQNINVEALLIRLFRQIGVGGTMTNLAYMGQFTNPLNHELIAQVEWGACGVAGVAAGHYCISIPANGQF